MADDLVVTAGDHRIRVRGLRTTLRAMQSAGVDAGDLRELMGTIGSLVASAAMPLARRESGAMAGSIRPGKAAQKVVIRAGGAAVPYAAVQHYGWPDRGITPNPYLSEGIARSTPQILSEFDAGIAALLRSHHLI